MDIPVGLVRDKRSAWAIVCYNMKGGVVTEAAVAASSPSGLLDKFALQHVRTHPNPAAPDASGCVMAIQISMS
jgi:outer membrane biosynthesis protein TonB